MKTHTLTAEVWLPISRETVFGYFSDARNLEALTPPWLRFAVLTPEPILMRAETLIDYRLRVHGLPLRWQSEITVWLPPLRFVDEQLHGPYRRWIHTHTFEERGGGTLCRDFVEYAVPGGSFINWLLVRRDLERIFAYRHRFLETIFRSGQAEHPSGSPLTCAAPPPLSEKFPPTR